MADEKGGGVGGGAMEESEEAEMEVGVQPGCLPLVLELEEAGERVTVHVPANCTARELKQHLVAMGYLSDGAPPGDLYYGGQRLDEDASILQYGIPDLYDHSEALLRMVDQGGLNSADKCKALERANSVLAALRDGAILQWRAAAAAAAPPAGEGDATLTHRESGPLGMPELDSLIARAASAGTRAMQATTARLGDSDDDALVRSSGSNLTRMRSRELRKIALLLGGGVLTPATETLLHEMDAVEQHGEPGGDGVAEALLPSPLADTPSLHLLSPVELAEFMNRCEPELFTPSGLKALDAFTPSSATWGRMPSGGLDMPTGSATGDGGGRGVALDNEYLIDNLGSLAEQWVMDRVAWGASGAVSDVPVTTATSATDTVHIPVEHHGAPSTTAMPFEPPPSISGGYALRPRATSNDGIHHVSLSLPSSRTDSATGMLDRPHASTSSSTGRRSRPRLALSKEEKRVRRMEQNRQSAERSRLRRRQWEEMCRTEVAQLTAENTALRQQLDALRDQVHHLQQLLAIHVRRQDPYLVSSPKQVPVQTPI
ncbi:hypothetical protein CDCA_CDCA13G3714 [Cyanidium caldarium]|uniref:BZIP domain-containing protein n=1 Tax=Cyanidium caldarium TaxID=2771 RepID=A0AAV9IZK3_CYACA|nr:hypothetical protein CDCA_CDCA13G3714 [Cyanidium caldarium]